MIQQPKVRCFPVHARWIAWSVLGVKNWECRIRASGARAQSLINMTNQVIALSLCQKRTSGKNATAEMMARDWTYFKKDPHSGRWTQEELYNFLSDHRGKIVILARVNWVSVMHRYERLSADHLSQCGASWKHRELKKMRGEQWEKRKSPDDSRLCVMHFGTMDVIDGPKVCNQRGKGSCFVLSDEELSKLHQSARRSQHNTTV